MSRDFVAEAVRYIYKPLVPAFKKVISSKFLKDDCHGASQLMARIPKAWRKRARRDALHCMRTFRALIKDTARVTGQSFMDAAAGVKHPKNPSLNATNFDDLQTNYDMFLGSNFSIWVDDEYKVYKESIANPECKLFIKAPIVRMLITRYVRGCVERASEALPDYLDESDCVYDTEEDNEDYREFYGNGQQESLVPGHA